MRSIIIVAIILVVAYIAVGITPDEEKQFQDFKKKFEKKYDTPQEESKRKAIFVENLKKIKEHNKLFAEGKVSWTQGVTQFTDWTHKEFEEHNFGILAPPKP